MYSFEEQFWARHPVGEVYSLNTQEMVRLAPHGAKRDPKIGTEARWSRTER